jgi:phage gp46-like protein
MADFETAWNPALSVADWRVDGLGLATGNDLATAVILSLFTDRLAAADDPLPDDAGAGGLARRGHWSDAPVGGGTATDDDRIGSRLWLLSREKLTEATRVRAETYCREALAWMVRRGVAKRVDVLVEIVPIDRLDIQVTVTRPDGRVETLTYSWAWQGLGG